MKTLRIHERQVTVASYQQRWLYVYSGIKRQVIFSFEDVIVDFCLDQGEDASWLLWAISQEGHVYRIEEKSISHQKPLESCVSDSEINDAIFGELFQDIPDITFTPTTESSCHISPKESIFKVDCEGAAVCADTDILAIAWIQKKTCKLNIYAKKNLLVDDSSKNACFSTNLSLQNPDFKDISLYIITSTTNACFSGSGNLCLEPSVFNSLFGTQTSILHSAVILLTISDGHVYYLPVKRWLPPSRPNDGNLCLLCDLKSPIIQVQVLDVDSVAAKDPANQLFTSFNESVFRFPGLLVCSLSGQCCLFSAPTNFKSNYQMMQKILLKDRPIVAGCHGAFAQQFFYSTLKNIVNVTFSFGERLEYSEQNCKRLAGIKNMASVIIEDETYLLCQSENGQFYSFVTSNDKFDAGDPTVSRNNTIPDLLAQLDDITQKIDQLHLNIKFQSRILSQLALVGHLHSEFNSASKHTIHSLKGSVSVKHTNGLTAISFRLTSNKIVLSSDWSLLVKMHKVSPGIDEEETGGKASFKSLRLTQGLQIGDSVQVDLLQNLKIPSDTRLWINAWLSLNFYMQDLGLYSSSVSIGQLKALEDQGITIHVFEGQTDFLDFVVDKELAQSELLPGQENKRLPPVSLIIDSIARKRPVFSAFEEIPSLSLSESFPEKLTYKILIPDSLSIILFDHTCHDVTHRSCLLKDLLNKMKISSGVETSGMMAPAASVTLDTTNWGQVTIEVQRNSNETTQYWLEIHAGSPGSLVELVLALMTRIKRLLPAELSKTLDVSKFISEIQKAKENLRSIEEDLKGKENLNCEKAMNHLLYFLLDVYNIDYQLSCHLHV